MTAWWYWLLFTVIVVVVLAGPWLCHRLEERDVTRRAKTWAKMPGATR